MTIPYQPEVERAHSTLTARLLFPNTRPQDNLLLVNLLWEDLNNEFIDRDQEETIATIGGNPNMDAGFNLVFGGAKSINRGKGYGWKNLSFKGLKVLLSDEKNPLEIGHIGPRFYLESTKLVPLARGSVDYAGLAEGVDEREIYQIKNSDSSIIVRDRSWDDYFSGEISSDNVILVEGLDRERYNALLEFTETQKRDQKGFHEGRFMQRVS